MCSSDLPPALRRPLTVPIHLAFSYDEEIGCLGVRPMIAEFGARLVKPRMVFVGEPTSMSVVDSHKGPVRWHVHIKGRAAHSSMAPLGVNSIAIAGKILRELFEFGDLTAREVMTPRVRLAEDRKSVV